MKIDVLHIDAFSSIPNKGNPAGVVLHAAALTDEEMQAIAEKIGFNETAFLLPSDVADFRIRYFTPGHEMNLCGHATMATVYAMNRAQLLKTNTFTIETKAGILPITCDFSKEVPFITMQHAKPQFIPFTGDVAQLAQAIGLSHEAIDLALPIMYGSTGAWTLIVPIKELASFSEMKPNTKAFPHVLVDLPAASVHPICLQVRDKDNTMHARHFSSPYSGTIEDPVTGTGSGVMGAYYKMYIEPSLPLPATLTVEQGHEMGKDGVVYVHLTEHHDELSVAISGTAIDVTTIEVTL